MKTNQIYMRAQEVAEELGVSVAHAYRVINKLNKELEGKGYIIMRGRIDRKFFHEKLYATKDEWKGDYHAGV